MLTPPPIAGIRVVVAEGSTMFARTVAEALSSGPGISVVGFAHDGVDAVRRVQDLKPDVLVLSLDIPRGDGARVLRELMQSAPVATVMLVPEASADAALARSLALLGAVESVAKPGLSDAGDVRERLRARLVPVVRSAGRMKVVRMVGSGVPTDFPMTPTGVRTPTPASLNADSSPPGGVPESRRIVLIGSSTGGPDALRAVLRALPADFPVPIVIAQHMPEGFTRDFARVLSGETKLPVHEAAGGEKLMPGVVYVGMGGANIRVKAGGRLEVVPQRDRSDNCPSVDVLFRTGALVYGSGALAVVLTGMGNDGESGVRAIKEAGGRVLAQDESTSRIYGMPKAAVDTGCVDRVLPLAMIAAQITMLCTGGSRA